jgi:hypothetical protein
MPDGHSNEDIIVVVNSTTDSSFCYPTSVILCEYSSESSLVLKFITFILNLYMPTYVYTYVHSKYTYVVHSTYTHKQTLNTYINTYMHTYIHTQSVY